MQAKQACTRTSPRIYLRKCVRRRSIAHTSCTSVASGKRWRSTANEALRTRKSSRCLDPSFVRSLPVSVCLKLSLTVFLPFLSPQHLFYVPSCGLSSNLSPEAHNGFHSTPDGGISINRRVRSTIQDDKTHRETLLQWPQPLRLPNIKLCAFRESVCRVAKSRRAVSSAILK